MLQKHNIQSIPNIYKFQLEFAGKFHFRRKKETKVYGLNLRKVVGVSYLSRPSPWLIVPVHGAHSPAVHIAWRAETGSAEAVCTDWIAFLGAIKHCGISHSLV